MYTTMQIPKKNEIKYNFLIEVSVNIMKNIFQTITVNAVYIKIENTFGMFQLQFNVE